MDGLIVPPKQQVSFPSRKIRSVRLLFIVASLAVCLAIAGCTAAAKKVSVQLPVIESFAASPASISSGGASTLSWTTTGATSVAITPGLMFQVR